jgi:hypothetical protein
MMPVKSNYSIDPTGLRFQIVDGVVCFDKAPVSSDVDEAFQRGRQKTDASAECADWLRSRLQYMSEQSKTIDEEAAQKGFTKYALREAKRILQVVAKPDGICGKWRISLPSNGETT